MVPFRIMTRREMKKIMKDMVGGKDQIMAMSLLHEGQFVLSNTRKNELVFWQNLQ